MNRVRPPSTRISKTASASRIPDWGRASQWLSILTASTRRSRSSGSSTGRPLIGDRGRSSIVVVGASVVVVGWVVVVAIVVDVVVVVSPAPPLQAVIARTSATTESRDRIGGMLKHRRRYSNQLEREPVTGKSGTALGEPSTEMATSMPSVEVESTYRASMLMSDRKSTRLNSSHVKI